MGRWLWKLGAYALGAYVIDVPIRRGISARAARAYADARGLPLLNVGAGTSGTSWAGPSLYGDVNLDLYGRRDVPHGPNVVTYGDAQDLREFATGSFGAVLASHIIEHLPNPDQALAEWSRVVGGDPNALFVVTPSWWAPHTFLHPGHLSYFTDSAGGTRGGRRVALRSKLGPTAGLLNLRGL